MVRAKNYETTSTFDEVMQKKNCGLFFSDTVYTVFHKKHPLSFFVISQPNVAQ